MEISLFDVNTILPKDTKLDFYRISPGTLFTHPEYDKHILMRLPSGNYKYGALKSSVWSNAIDLDETFRAYIENILAGNTDLTLKETVLEDIKNTGNIFHAGDSIDDWASAPNVPNPNAEGMSIVVQNFLETSVMRLLLEAVRRNAIPSTR